MALAEELRQRLLRYYSEINDEEMYRGVIKSLLGQVSTAALIRLADDDDIADYHFRLLKKEF